MAVWLLRPKYTFSVIYQFPDGSFNLPVYLSVSKENLEASQCPEAIPKLRITLN